MNEDGIKYLVHSGIGIPECHEVREIPGTGLETIHTPTHPFADTKRVKLKLYTPKMLTGEMKKPYDNFLFAKLIKGFGSFFCILFN